MKKRYVLFIIVFAVALVAFSSCSTYDTEKVLITKYFTDIEQFSVMDEYVTKDLSPDDDKYLKDIPYAESYTKQLEFEGKKYQVYAYEFNNVEDARNYFKAVSGRDTAQKYDHRTKLTSYSKSFCLVISNNNVYRFNGRKIDSFTKAYNCLTEGFPVCYKTLDNAVIGADFGLYQFVGDEKFSEMINKNPIDPYIRAKYDQTQASSSLLSFVADEEDNLWKAELDNALQKLRVCLEEPDLTKFNASQTAWEANVKADIAWQTSLFLKSPLEKEPSQFDALYGVKLYEANLYKQRTIEVKYFHYLHDNNADISFVFKG